MSNLKFISIVDMKGRKSTLSLGGRINPDHLCVVGNLEHNAYIKPASVADANMLIEYLSKFIREEQS